MINHGQVSLMASLETRITRKRLARARRIDNSTRARTRHAVSCHEQLLAARRIEVPEFARRTGPIDVKNSMIIINIYKYKFTDEKGQSERLK